MALVFFLVRGCGCGRKTKSRARARVALSFCGWPRGQIRTRRTGPHPKPFKRPSHVACRLRWPLAVLSSRAVVNKKTGSVSRAALRSAQAAQTTRYDETDDARERLTSPDIRRIKRRPDPTSASREPERATAVPSFHFTPTQSGSRCQRKISFG